MNRLLLCGLAAACLPLSACEGTLGISLSATPPEDASAAVLRVTGMSLLKQDGSSRRIDIDPDRDIDLLGLDRGSVTALISGEELGAGDYTGLTLELEADSQELDSYLEDSAGAQTSLVLNAGSAATASAAFRIRDDEDTQLTVHFDLRSSLLPGDTAAGDRQMRPQLRLLETSATGAVAGNVDARLLQDAGCATEAAEQVGEVVYVFAGSGITADDLDGASPEPLTTALLRSTASAADYVASFLPAGDYTLAVTCNADVDDPRSNDDIGFITSATVSVSANATATLNFSP